MMAKYGTAIPDDFKPITSKWMRAKLVHDKQKSEGRYCFSINGVKGEPLKPELDWTSEETQEIVRKLTEPK